MCDRYAQIAKLQPDSGEHRRTVSAFLERVRSFIADAPLDPAFVAELRKMLEEMFGTDGSYGVFVRSDTNVEDLPGFTGAGLNLTVPNVVDFDRIVAALREVWASPFSDRSYAWRQSRLTEPQYVFPAVLIQYSFPAEKSGVLVTADLENDEPGWLTVAVNEGVGGAVDGQAAESLRVRRSDGSVRFLSRATAPYRSVLDPKGGILREHASGAESVLTADEIRRLIDLAAEVPQRFPALRDASGAPAAADIELAFRRGKLALLQIRPLVENRGAERSRYLGSLDAPMRERAQLRVDLRGVPQ
jgi:phosphoenolpyruvate synthase/pyruvate phosphate dikinase